MKPTTKKAAKARPKKVKAWEGWAIVGRDGSLVPYNPPLMRRTKESAKIWALPNERVVKVRVEVIP